MIEETIMRKRKEQFIGQYTLFEKDQGVTRVSVSSKSETDSIAKDILNNIMKMSILSINLLFKISLIIKLIIYDTVMNIRQ